MSAAKFMAGCAAIAIVVVHLGNVSQERRPASGASATSISGRPPALPSPPKTMMASVAPTPASAVGFGTVEISPDRAGQYQTSVEIEGLSVAVLIDTGASHVVLTYEDADRLGIRPMPSDFKYGSMTANGQVANAKVEIREIRLGSVTVSNVTAFVAPRGALFRTLIGMNFLSRLKSFRIDDGRLILQP